MKKLIALTSSLAICLSAVPFCASAAEVPSASEIFSSYSNQPDYDAIVETFDAVTAGTYDIDFNGDGNINKLDAQLVVNFYAYVQCGNYTKDGEPIDGYAYSGTLDELDPKDSEYLGNVAAYYLNDSDIRAAVVATGDVDGDGSVSAVDAHYIMRYYASFFEDGDVALDGTVDSADASYVLSYYGYTQTGTAEPDLDKSIYDDGVSYEQIEMKGDINGDGVVNAVDASDIITEYAENQAK